MDSSKRGDTKPSGTARTRSTPKKSFSLGCLTDGWIRPRFGPTSTPSTANPGVDELTSSRVVSHVSTFQSRENKLESRESTVPSGSKCYALLTKYDHDTSSWKTPQISVFGESMPFSGPWPTSGVMKLPGVVYPLDSWAHLIKGTGSGLSVRAWPTPQANEDAAGTPNGKMQRMLGNHPDIRSTGDGTLAVDFVCLMMGYPKGWVEITTALDGSAVLPVSRQDKSNEPSNSDASETPSSPS